MIEPKKVVGAVDPPPLTLRELREPGREEPIRAWGFGKGRSQGRAGLCTQVPEVPRGSRPGARRGPPRGR